MTAINGLGQKIMEWAVIGILVGAVGFLVGNNEAATMRLEINRLTGDNARHERDIAKLQAQIEANTPRIDRLEVQAQMEREERMKGDSK